MLHRPHSLPVPHAMHVRLPISLGSMRTVLSHLRRAARNIWANLQRTGAKRTPQLCDSGELRASHASLRCHGIRPPLLRLRQPPDTGRAIFPNALSSSPIDQQQPPHPHSDTAAGFLSRRKNPRRRFGCEDDNAR